MFNEELLGKLSAMKAQAEETKARLENLHATEEVGGGLIRITLNGNRKLIDLTINGDHSTMDKEELEDLLSVAINRVLDKVNDLNEQEVMQSAQSLFKG